MSLLHQPKLNPENSSDLHTQGKTEGGRLGHVHLGRVPTPRPRPLFWLFARLGRLLRLRSSSETSDSESPGQVRPEAVGQWVTPCPGKWKHGLPAVQLESNG